MGSTLLYKWVPLVILLMQFLFHRGVNACSRGSFQSCVKNHCRCLVCPQGSYCDGTTSIGVCPSGSISYSGASTLNDCFSCPAGAFCSGGLIWACPQGTYSEKVGAKDESTCLYCDPGYFSYDDTSQPCEYECGAGYYCYKGEYSACPLGTFSTDTTAWNVTSCQACPLHTFSDYGSYKCKACSQGGFNGLGNQCGNCQVGHYCTTLDEKVTACPIGTYNPLSNSTLITDCLTCNNGYYTDTVGQALCSKCEPGGYCVNGTRHLCPPNTFSSSRTASSITECHACQSGYVSNEGSNVCTLNVTCALFPGYTGVNCNIPCPVGYYCNEGVQFPCPGGAFSSIQNASSINSCYSCPSGTFSKEGSSLCTNCPDGYYSKSNTANECSQ